MFLIEFRLISPKQFAYRKVSIVPNNQEPNPEGPSGDPLSYRDAGVDIDAGNALVGAIKSVTQRTLRPEVLTELGGFGALCALPRNYRDPILVAATDGVGTKLMLANNGQTRHHWH